MRKDRLGFRRLKKLINSDNDTKELIESSVREIEIGTNAALKTAKILDEVVE